MIGQFDAHHLHDVIIIRGERERHMAHGSAQVDFDTGMKQETTGRLDYHHVDAKGTCTVTQVEKGYNLFSNAADKIYWDIAT